MKRLILTAVAAGLLAIGANAATVTPTTPSQEGGCYQIGTVAELYGFANIVNGDGTTKNSAACGKLTADIIINEKVLDAETGKWISGKNYANAATMNGWDVIHGFTGKFDGNGKTISGLGNYCVGTGNANCAFFGSVGGNAEIKNLNIKDSYIKNGNSATAILVAEVSGSSVTIDGVSIDATVLALTDNSSQEYAGLMVGKVSSGTLNIYNSSVKGRVVSAMTSSDSTSVLEIETPSAGSKMGGFVGGIASGSVNFLNSYNLGASIVSTGSSEVGAFVGSGSANLTNSFCTGTSNYSGNTYCSSNLDAQKLEVASKSMSLAYNSEGKLVATLHDNIVEFRIIEGVNVAQVVYDRVFTTGAASTIVTPFTPNGVTIDGGELLYLNKMVKGNDTNYTGVEALRVESMHLGIPYNPYVIYPTKTTVSFSGNITLASNYSSNHQNWQNFAENQGNWHFAAVTQKKRWEKAGGKNPENSCEIGRIYVFAGTSTTATDGKTEIKVGDFVKVLNKVAVTPLRAYLAYGGQCSDEGASANTPNNKPDPDTEEISIEDLPSSLSVIIVDDKEENGNDEEGTTVLRKTVKVPASVNSSGRWHDVVGRNLGGQPKSRGVFVNDRVPVMVK